MVLAKVVGTVVSTQKEASMDNLRFMLVQPVDLEGAPSGGQVVAVDAVGSGPGEYVLYASGSSARQTVITDKRPCDAVIMAIVDNWEIDGQIKYRKGEAERG
ncbi:MAG: EutN/CcmL family microcompartment protein [bacterium]|nr:EutN/CcmL family microcompartment protein [bacterium]